MTSDSTFPSGRILSHAFRPPIVLVGVVLLGVIARVVWLDRLPGIDGDEAWYGVNIQVFREGGAPFWRTGVGNLLNPFHSLLLYLLSFVMEPSGTHLRMPEVIWGILAILIAYPLFAPSLRPRAAAIVAVLLALSPTAIAYSRFGWDPSGMLLASLLAIGFALRGQVMAASLSTLAALLVHPTGIFLIPIVLSGFGPALAARHALLSDAAKRRLRNATIAAVVLGAPAALWFLNTLARNPNTSVPSIEIVFGRVFSATAWLQLAQGTLRLFSGASTMADMAGPLSMTTRSALDLMAVVVLIIPLALAVRYGARVATNLPPSRKALRRTAVALAEAGQVCRSAHFSAGHSSRGLWLLAGFLVSVVAFHVVAGPVGLASGRERYGLFLLVPEIVLVAMAIDGLADSRPFVARFTMTVAVISFVALTLGGYFAPLIARGGGARAGLRTGVVEPKMAAYEFMKTDSRSAEVIRVIAEDWYLYWPLRYLAGTDTRFHVEMRDGVNAPGGLRPASVAAPPYPHAPDATYSLVFDNGGEWRRLRAAGESAAFTAHDPLGRPILHVVRAPRPF